jgi:hypothetical protein
MLCLYIGAAQKIVMFTFVVVSANYFACHCLQMKALKDLGLDVTKGSVTTDSAVTQTKFHIMRSWVLAPSCFIFMCSI